MSTTAASSTTAGSDAGIQPEKRFPVAAVHRPIGGGEQNANRVAKVHGAITLGCGIDCHGYGPVAISPFVAVVPSSDTLDL